MGSSSPGGLAGSYREGSATGLRLELVVLMLTLLLGPVVAGAALRAGILGFPPRPGSPVRLAVPFIVGHAYPVVLAALLVYAYRGGRGGYWLSGLSLLSSSTALAVSLSYMGTRAHPLQPLVYGLVGLGLALRARGLEDRRLAGAALASSLAVTAAVGAVELYANIMVRSFRPSFEYRILEHLTVLPLLVISYYIAYRVSEGPLGLAALVLLVTSPPASILEPLRVLAPLLVLGSGLLILAQLGLGGSGGRLDYSVAFALLLYMAVSGSVAFIYRYLNEAGVIHPWYKVEAGLAGVVSLAVFELYPVIPAFMLFYSMRGVTPGPGYALRVSAYALGAALALKYSVGYDYSLAIVYLTVAGAILSVIGWRRGLGVRGYVMLATSATALFVLGYTSILYHMPRASAEFGLDKLIALFSVYPLLAIYMALECIRSREFRCLLSLSLYLASIILGLVIWLRGLGADYSIVVSPLLLASVAVLSWPPPGASASIARRS